MNNIFRARARADRLASLALVLGLCAVGCGSKTDMTLSSPETYCTAIKAAVYECCATVRTRGAKTAPSDVADAIERLEGYDEKHLGEHFGTYQKIYEKLTSLKKQLASSPSNADLKQAVDEIIALADKLPGQADKKFVNR